MRWLKGFRVRMADPRFFKKKKPLSIREIVSLTGAIVGRGDDQSLIINDVSPIHTAKKAVSYTHLTLPTILRV